MHEPNFDLDVEFIRLAKDLAEQSELENARRDPGNRETVQRLMNLLHLD